jgi:hypothetical protein
VKISGKIAQEKIISHLTLGVLIAMVGKRTLIGNVMRSPLKGIFGILDIKTPPSLPVINVNRFDETYFT